MKSKKFYETCKNGEDKSFQHLWWLLTMFFGLLSWSFIVSFVLHLITSFVQKCICEASRVGVLYMMVYFPTPTFVSNLHIVNTIIVISCKSWKDFLVRTNIMNIYTILMLKGMMMHTSLKCTWKIVQKKPFLRKPQCWILLIWAFLKVNNNQWVDLYHNQIMNWNWHNHFINLWDPSHAHHV